MLSEHLMREEVLLVSVSEEGILEHRKLLLFIVASPAVVGLRWPLVWPFLRLEGFALHDMLLKVAILGSNAIRKFFTLLERSELLHADVSVALNLVLCPVNLCSACEAVEEVVELYLVIEHEGLRFVLEEPGLQRVVVVFPQHQVLFFFLCKF